jgi:hypothetical protein
MFPPRLRRGIALFALLAGAPFVSSAASSVRVKEGFYRYSLPVKGEHASVLDGEDAPVPFSHGRLTDGDVTRPVHWAGEQGAPRTMQVVFDLLADTPLETITLHTRRPNRHHRTDSVSVDYRAEADAHYRSALFSREGVKDPWDLIDIPMRGKKARFVRVTFTRRHSFVNTPLTEVEFAASAASSTTSRSAGSPVRSPAANLAAEFARDTLLVDRYGQFLYEEWPGKIRSDDDLRRDLETERRKLAAASPAPDIAGSGETPATARPLTATGFFRLEKIDGRWWFVTPDGKPWFMNGVCVTDYREGGYSTALFNKQGEPRGVFAGLPDRQTYGGAFETLQGHPKVNFLTANLMAKYGDDYHSAWAELMRLRLRDWGFNANAKWTRAPILGLPYITVLRPHPNTPRIKYAVDPFDPDFAANVEAGVRDTLAAMRDDPLIIGHTFESEKGWDFDVFAEMLRRDATTPAKVAFVDFLLERHRHDATALARVLGHAETSRDALIATPLAFPETLHDDARAFIAEASKRYYRTAVEIIRRHDPNHLILGSSLTPGWHSSYEWEIGAVDFVDALSFDYYVSSPAWIEPYLKFDLPILLLEYSFVTSGRGLPGFHTTVPTQRDRGLYYRHFIEHLAALPQFVGAGWFLLYDQPVTGRDPAGGGECHNFGLLNQQDQPYEEMLEEVRKTSRRLFDLHAGKLAPFVYENLVSKP